MNDTATHMVRTLLGERVVAAAERVDRRRRSKKEGGFDPFFVNEVARDHDVEERALCYLFGFCEQQRNGRLSGWTSDPTLGELPDDPDELTALAISRWVKE